MTTFTVTPLKLVQVPFNHATPGLTGGHAVYTPKKGQVLLDAWVEVDVAWQGGAQALLDLGTFAGTPEGLFSSAGLQFDLANGDIESYGRGMLYNANNPSLAGAGITNGGTARIAPLRFTTTDPFKVVVSQNGKVGGDNPGSTQGSGKVFLLVAS